MDKWSLAIRAFSRVKDVPSELGSPVIAQYVEDGASLITQWTGSNVDLNDIGSKFHVPLTSFATIMILNFKEGVGISYNLGTMRIDKTTELQGVSSQLQNEINMFNLGLQSLGKRVFADRTDPTW